MNKRRNIFLLKPMNQLTKDEKIKFWAIWFIIITLLAMIPNFLFKEKPKEFKQKDIETAIQAIKNDVYLYGEFDRHRNQNKEVLSELSEMINAIIAGIKSEDPDKTNYITKVDDIKITDTETYLDISIHDKSSVLLSLITKIKPKEEKIEFTAINVDMIKENKTDQILFLDYIASAMISGDIHMFEKDTWVMNSSNHSNQYKNIKKEWTNNGKKAVYVYTKGE